MDKADIRKHKAVALGHRCRQQPCRYYTLHVAALSPASCLCLPLPAWRQHDLVDKVDDGRGGLIRVQLGEQVANVLCQAARLLGYEAKHPEREGVGEGNEDVRGKKEGRTSE